MNEPAPDVTLSKIDQNDPVPSGIVLRPSITYELTAANVGTDPADDVVVTDTLPAGADFVSSVPGEPTCSQSAGVVSCNLGQLGVSASTQVTVNIQGPLATTQHVIITNIACVAASNEPSGANNNCDSEDTCIDTSGDGDIDGDGYSGCP
jgi:hypothetical protein